MSTIQVRWRGWAVVAIAAWGAQAVAGQQRWQAAGFDELASRAQQILKQRCVQCHGTQGRAFNGVVVDDHARLVGSRDRPVAPRDDQSLLLRLVREGTMPPGDAELTATEVETLTRWVAQGAPPWPEDAVPPRREFFGEADTVRAIGQDLLSLPQRHRRFIRHFSLVHLYNAGVGEQEIGVHRQALAKLLNSLSWQRRTAVPQALGPEPMLLRIDIRDYGWTERTWRRLIDRYPYVLGRFDEQSIQALSGSPVAYLRADWFVAEASEPPLYYEILGLPPTVSELEQLLGVDTVRHLAEERGVIRGGVGQSGVSRNNRVLERHDAPHGAYWKSFDFRSNAGLQNIFQHPLDFRAAGGEVIFHLPNWMQGYYLADADGRRIDKGPSDVVFDRTNPSSAEIVVGRSCMSCHADGMKRFRDDVRPVLVRRPLSEERETALMLYAGQADLDRLLDEDESRFRRALFDATGERPSETVREPIGRVANAYQAPLGFRRAAAELGDQPTRLSTRLDFNQRRGRLLGLDALTVGGGTVSRDSWEGTFKEAVRAFDLGDGHLFGSQAARSRRISRLGRVRPSAGGSRDPAFLRREARSLYVHSGTTRFRVEAVQEGFGENKGFQELGIVFVDRPSRADLMLRVGRPVFTFDFTYQLTDRRTGVVLASGRFTAADAKLGIQRIVATIVAKLSSARLPPAHTPSG